MAQRPFEGYDEPIDSQLLLFQYVWKSRPHECEICATPLLEPKFECFAHVLGKKAFPLFKLRPKNIKLMCGDCHHVYDTENDSIMIGFLQSKRYGKTVFFKNYQNLKNLALLLKRQYKWYWDNQITVDYRIKNIYHHG